MNPIKKKKKEFGEHWDLCSSIRNQVYRPLRATNVHLFIIEYKILLNISYFVSFSHPHLQSVIQ